MKKKYLLIMVPILVVLLGIMAVLITITVFNSDNGSLYTKNIGRAEKYLSNQDYENAILYFEKAINLNDSDEDAYIGLAKAYHEKGVLDKAIETLEKGYRITKSGKIKSLLDEYKNEQPDTQPEPVTDKTAETKELTFNDTVFDMFASYTYKDYVDRYSVTIEKPISEKEYTVQFNNLNYRFSFIDENEYKAINTTTGKPFDNAVPGKIESDTLENLVSGIGNGFGTDELKKKPGVTNVKASKDTEYKKHMLQFDYRDCRVRIVSDESGRVTSSNCLGVVTPLLRNANDNNTYTFSAELRDAASYNPISSSVTIKAREGKNTKTGDPKAETTSSNGSFTLQLPVGDYTLECSGGGYVKDYFNIHVSSTGGAGTEVIVMSPVVTSGSVRVVLTWGNTPRDLDGHLIGNSSKGDSVHVYFMNKTHTGVASLDVDNVNGNGCETTEIKDMNGTYKYVVNRYSYDGSIGSSGAVIKIYDSNNNVTTITPPASVDPVNWSVFEIKDGRVENIDGIVS